MAKPSNSHVIQIIIAVVTAELIFLSVLPGGLDPIFVAILLVFGEIFFGLVTIRHLIDHAAVLDVCEVSDDDQTKQVN